MNWKDYRGSDQTTNWKDYRGSEPDAQDVPRRRETDFDSVRAECERLCPGVEIRKDEGEKSIFLTNSDGTGWCNVRAWDDGDITMQSGPPHGKCPADVYTRYRALLTAALHVAKWMEAK